MGPVREHVVFARNARRLHENADLEGRGFQHPLILGSLLGSVFGPALGLKMELTWEPKWDPTNQKHRIWGIH